MYKVISEASGQEAKVEDLGGGNYSVNDKPFQADIIKTGGGRLHLLVNGKSHTAELISWNKEEKEARILFNGKEERIRLLNKFDLLLKEMGFDKMMGNKVSQLKAPMPGLVLRIQTEPGAAVKKGDTLLVLEAMKMENMIKSPGDGTVKAVYVNAGTAVDKNQVLIEFE